LDLSRYNKKGRRFGGRKRGEILAGTQLSIQKGEGNLHARQKETSGGKRPGKKERGLKRQS